MKAKILKIGNACNNSCGFCFERGRTYETDSKKIMRLLDDARPGCPQVVFTGLEPTIHPDIIELVRHAKELEYRVIQVVSNGRMFAYGKFARDMVYAGMTELLVPIHSHRKEVHDAITGVDKSLAQTMKGIKNVIDVSAAAVPFNQVTVSAGVVVCPENVRDLTHIGPFAARYGVKEIFFIRLQGEMPQPAGADVRAFLPQAIAAARQAGLDAFTIGFGASTIPDPDDCSYESFTGAHRVFEPDTVFDTFPGG